MANKSGGTRFKRSKRQAKQRKEKEKKKIFWQDLGQYEGTIVVAVGADVGEIFKFIEKEKRDPGGWLLRAFKKEDKVMRDLIECGITGFVVDNKETLGNYILWLKEYSWKDWKTIEVLIHELHHIVEFRAQYSSFENEMENKAYLQEYLFRSIRKKLAN